jgi:hypothetical protein
MLSSKVNSAGIFSFSATGSSQDWKIKTPEIKMNINENKDFFMTK